MAVVEKDPAAKVETAAAETTASRAVKVMEDPFGSMYAALISTGMAVTAVISGIFGLSLIH
jgi:hypothetical protein